MNIKFFKIIFVLGYVLTLTSCDKEYNNLGSDIIGNENFEIEGVSYEIIAYNTKTPAVQTSNLPVNQLGVFVSKKNTASGQSTIFGTTKYNFVTQLSLATVKPTFTSNVVIDSVILTVPYFSTKTGTGDDGSGIYNLDRVYTTNAEVNKYDPINLKVFRINYSLNETNLGGSIQKHFSNEDEKFRNNIIGSVLNNSSNENENIKFTPTNKEYKKYKVVDNAVANPKEVESRSSPRMRLHLDNNYFKTEILDKANATINSTSALNFETDIAFKNYFKGLYFQVEEAISDKGTSMALDFAKGDVTIYYKQDVTKDDPSKKEMKSLVLNMQGNTVNLFTTTNDTYSAVVPNEASDYSKKNGDKDLYLKGGQGSTVFLNLFRIDPIDPANPTKPRVDELQTLRDDYKANKILINDATITFTVDASKMTSDYYKPQRIYVYDALNNKPIIDYYFDTSTNSTNSLLNKSLYGGILEEVAGGKFVYKIKITQHIINLIKNVSGKEENVKLGVVITDNINSVGNGSLNPEIPDFKATPVANIISPMGTVLHGNHSDVPQNDVKFQIFFTKPN